jgi:hypothetical protein
MTTMAADRPQRGLWAIVFNALSRRMPERPVCLWIRHGKDILFAVVLGECRAVQLMREILLTVEIE